MAVSLERAISKSVAAETSRSDFALISLGAISSAEVAREPFEFFTASDIFTDGALAAVQADFPAIEKPGIFPLSSLDYSGAFAQLIDEISSPELSRVIGSKFDIDLEGLPLMITVRGHAQKRDGRIHTDTKDKVVTCLLYLNDRWVDSSGRLRLLRSGDDLEDFAAEVPPSGGTLAAFKVASNSWHGHKPFIGQRRYVMFNWLRSQDSLSRQIGRHTVSATVKNLIPFFYKGK